MKKIVFSIVTNGMDGMGKRTYVASSFDEVEILKAHKAHKNVKYNSLFEEIVDIEFATKAAKAKLNSVDNLLLGLDKVNHCGTIRAHSIVKNESTQGVS